MTSIPDNIGTIHFTGIGGIGMSGIAEILHNLGYKVQGSDLSENLNVHRLRNLGIKVFIGQAEQNVANADVLVKSSAVTDDNPEIIAARRKFIPVVRRAEMLGELMRFKSSIAIGGTHGKTTTTSLVSTILDGADLDPTVINGGIINSYNTNARLGSGKWMVVEADESDGSFLKLPATISVVTNIDPEHLVHYGSFENLKLAFEQFILSIPFYGFAVLCLDHPTVQSIIPNVTERRVITYGTNPQADVRLKDHKFQNGGSLFSVEINTRKSNKPRIIENIYLPMVGHHNVLNTLAAITIAHELDLSDKVIIESLGQFKGVKRRFTKTGAVNGVSIYDDYAHHPVEITAVLKAARQATDGKVIAVVQPHRYSRVADLFEEFCSCFNDADIVIMADIYEAGESPIEGVTKETLVEGIERHGHRQAMILKDQSELAQLVRSVSSPKDFVICMGAGDITRWAAELPNDLAQPPTATSIKEVFAS
jgi:UDP-N-acetylmuramate--alanine ligase